MSRNPFFLSDNPDERIINEAVINKIPAEVTSSSLGGTFGGDIPKDIFDRFTNLTTLNLTYPGGGSKQFAAATNPGVCTCPNVSNTVTNYTLRNNGFTSFDSSPGQIPQTTTDMVSVKTSTAIVNLDLQGCGLLTDNTFSIDGGNSSIQNININFTRLPIPDLNGKQSLVRFQGINITNIGQSLTFFTGNTYKFDNCNALQSIELQGTGMSGALPQFNNAVL